MMSSWTCKCKVKQTIQPTKFQKEIILISYVFYCARDRKEGAKTWSLNLIFIKMSRNFKLWQSKGNIAKNREILRKQIPQGVEYANSLYCLISVQAAPSPGLISQLWQHLDYSSTDSKYVLAANPVYPIVHKTLLWNRIWLPKILASPSPTSSPPAPPVWLEP